MSEPTALHSSHGTTTTHRPGCQRPGWDVAPSRSIRGVSVARCRGCGAVELRTEVAR